MLKGLTMSPELRKQAEKCQEFQIKIMTSLLLGDIDYRSRADGVCIKTKPMKGFKNEENNKADYA